MKTQAGFTLLETLLAIIVITIAGLGAYSLFNSGLVSSNLADTVDEMVEIANVYTDLASSNLTKNISSSAQLVTLLQSSGRLSSKYFAADGSMVNAYGATSIAYSSVTPYGFTAAVPLALYSASTDGLSAASQFCSKVQDVYSSCTTKCSGAPCISTATVTYSVNN